MEHCEGHCVGVCEGQSSQPPSGGVAFGAQEPRLRCEGDTSDRPCSWSVGGVRDAVPRVPPSRPAPGAGRARQSTGLPSEARKGPLRIEARRRALRAAPRHVMAPPGNPPCQGAGGKKVGNGSGEGGASSSPRSEGGLGEADPSPRPPGDRLARACLRLSLRLSLRLAASQGLRLPGRAWDCLGTPETGVSGKPRGRPLSPSSPPPPPRPGGAGGTVLPGSLGAAAGGHGGARTRTSNQSKCSLSKCSLNRQKAEIRNQNHRPPSHSPLDSARRRRRAGRKSWSGGERAQRSGRGGRGRGG